MHDSENTTEYLNEYLRIGFQLYKVDAFGFVFEWHNEAWKFYDRYTRADLVGAGAVKAEQPHAMSDWRPSWASAMCSCFYGPIGTVWD